ncbi:MAG: glycosyltransferase [Xanthomonadales bacterium]|nr:glycosyltransferase [Xanthomonadales bacterium]
MDPVVSVVLPVRNGGGYLQEAVQSILRQSFDSLELILVDDGSNDGAVSRLTGDDPRLVLLSNPGRGVSSAFNTGFECATGAFIARMDADDLSLPQRLETQYRYLQKHPGVDICGACVEIFSDQEILGGNLRYQAWLNECRSPERIRRELFIESPIPNPTAMFRRAALQSLGGYRDPEWPEDYDLFLRADAAGMRMGKPDPVLYRWREHGQRLTRTDPRYHPGKFQAAKAHYLSLCRLSQERPLVIWGAGPGGRLMHDLLAQEGTSVTGFLEVHPRRIGGRKRDLPVWPIDEIGRMPEVFVLVAVGAAGVRPEIRQFMQRHDRVEGEHYLFVA